MKKILQSQRQVLSFILAGGLSAFVEIGLFKIFSIVLPNLFSWENNLYGMHFPLSNILSTSCGIITNYFFSIWFVFQRGKYSKRKEFAYFMGVSLVTTVLSLLVFQFFYKFLFKTNFDFGIFVLSPEILSKISAIILVSIFSYSIKKKVIFNG